MNDSQAIAAIATAPGTGAVGIVRLSGLRLDAFVAGLIGKPLPPRQAVLTEFRDGAGEAIDQGIALFFPRPLSYTGEDVLELQGHGGLVVLQRLLARCCELGARLAQPGEFTQRAYLNGKLDLAQAESVADLISAATITAARGAMRSLQGAFSSQVQRLAQGLIDLRALVEAALDFPDEDIESVRPAQLTAALAELRRQLDALLAASRQGSLLREGVHIVLVGQPNVGKSSLLNRLAGEELAIVTEIPGTTRDAIRQTVSLNGVAAHFIDTAGLREARDTVERLGIERTWAAIEKADLALLVVDARSGEGEAERVIRERLPQGLPCIAIMNKADLLPGDPGPVAADHPVYVSAKTGMGLERLKQAVLREAGWLGNEEGVFIARERHVQALLASSVHLERATGQLTSPELLAEELRLAHEALGAITGRYTSDELLGEIFSRFCIGK